MASKALRFGLVIDPPTLFCEFQTAEAAFKHVRLEFEGLTSSVNVTSVVEGVVREISAHAQCDSAQIRRLVQKLVDGPQERKKLIDGSVDLNKVDDTVLSMAKQEMSRDFEKNRITQADEGFKWSVEKTFQPSMASDWDEEESD